MNPSLLRQKSIMFSLPVNSMGGSFERLPCVKIESQVTLADVRARIKETTPELIHFGEVKLFQGQRELMDDDVVKIDLQGMIGKSPAAALTAVGNMFPEWVAGARCCRTLLRLSKLQLFI